MWLGTGQGDRALSKEDDIKAAASWQLLGESEDERWLQVDLRLRLDEIVRREADPLRSKAPVAPSKRELIELASRIYEARRTRERIFQRKIFGEPAWDMLLALYCLPRRGKFLSATSLSYAASVPSTTGLRWQLELMKHGLIERGPPGVDARMRFMRLTELGRELLEKYLTRLHSQGTPIR